MRYAAVGALALAAVLTGYAIVYLATAPPQRAGMSATSDLAPSVRGLYRGADVLFVHTEASDRSVAEMLTAMTGRRVLVVPSLARVPGGLLADVYVFTNGVSGTGPFGFQPDVFSSVPGEPGYTPLRSVVLVTWTGSATPRVLGSVEEIRAAADRGELSLRRTAVVVNMPILAWPGGHR